MSDSTSPHTAQRQAPGILWTLGRLHGELRARHGLSLHDYLILGALAEAANGSAPVAGLTAFLGESGGRMSYVLRDMQASGLIERDRDERDRRAVKVTLTDAGRGLSADAERTAQAIVRRHLVPGSVAALDGPPAPTSPTP
ncbi:MarR family winged helix-turn-helix transcriptional regulator [Streptomyces sp. NPDC057950]|uniref:MarR family winged helix-turn-helix transcriptional regulator n=1 Tax=Streptomyces sp. NPDC057950 TaxID=3346288 RepID=UPI0036EF0D01